MGIVNEFGNSKVPLNLGTEKLWLLLDVLLEEREDFISKPHEVNGQTKTVDEMTSRELQKVIKEKKKLEEKRTIKRIS